MTHLTDGCNVERVEFHRGKQEARLAFFLAQRSELSREQTVGTCIALARCLAAVYLVGLGYGEPDEHTLSDCADSVITSLIQKRITLGLERTEDRL